MADQWFWSRGGKQFGPYSREQLSQLAATEQMLPDDQVWSEGATGWVQAATIPGLFAANLVQGLVGESPGGAIAAVAVSSLAMRHVCEIIAGNVMSDAAGAAVNYLRRYFSDQSQQLPKALNRSCDRAWRVVEMALAGDRLMERIKAKAARAEDKSLVKTLRAYLGEIEPPNFDDQNEFRFECLAELRSAKKAGRLTTEALKTDDVADQSADFARFDDPRKLMNAEWRLIDMMAQSLRPDFPNLAWLMEQRPQTTEPLLVVAVRYYFRREVEENEKLFHGLAYSQLENLTKSQQASFEWMVAHGKEVESALDDLTKTLRETHEKVEQIDQKADAIRETGQEIQTGVLRIEEELQRQDPKFQQIYEVVLDLQRKLDMQSATLRPGASFSIRNDVEKREVRAFLEQYRGIGSKERVERPALMNAVAQLEVAAGEFDAAQSDFQSAAELVGDEEAKAEIHHNRFQSYLESKQWDLALEAMAQSASLARERFAPFPMEKYVPARILGAGGFGVAYLCENRNTGAHVVLKTLRAEAGVDVNEIMREARLLGGLRHPSIIQLFDCDYADTARRRAYLVMEYFDPRTLESQIKEHGAFSPDEFRSLAMQMAEALRAAHERDVLHRDVKPANVLVRKESAGWRLKVIDFGLAVANEVLLSDASTDRGTRDDREHSISGTLEYAAPEQLGKLRGARIGPPADVYGFGKTCCYALLQTTNPLPRHFRELPSGWTDLLEACLEENPSQRPQTFLDVLDRLRSIGASAPQANADPALWYYLDKGAQNGPHSLAKMVEFVSRGVIQPKTMIWRRGNKDWTAASNEEKLFPRVGVAKAMPAVKPASTKVGGVVRLIGLGGVNTGGSLIVYLDDEKIGRGSALTGFHLDFETEVGHHVLKVESDVSELKEVQRGMQDTPGGLMGQLFDVQKGAEQVFPLWLKESGNYEVTLGFGGMSGWLRKAAKTGGTRPTTISVKKVK